MKKIITICLISVLVYACQKEIAVTAPTNFTYSVASTICIQGTVGSSVVPTINDGRSAIKFTLSGIAVSGISISTGTGVLTWTKSLVVGTYNITVLATNSVGSISTIYTLVVNGNGAITAPSSLIYNPASTTIVAGTAGVSVAPTISDGGASIAYDLIGTIPAGVGINHSTGIISWSNAVVAGTYNIDVKATNSVGNTSTSYLLSVNNTATVTAPSSLAYNPASYSVTQGTAGSSVSPSINNGLGTIAYTLTGTIPTGVSINSSTGVISWSSTVTAGIYNLSIKASNSAGSTTSTYVLTVNAVAAKVSFASAILPTLSASCGGCHSYTKTYTGVIGHTTGCSSIQDKMGTTYCTGARMPLGGTPLTAAYIASFNTWIAQGQLNN